MAFLGNDRQGFSFFFYWNGMWNDVALIMLIAIFWLSEENLFKDGNILRKQN